MKSVISAKKKDKGKRSRVLKKQENHEQPSTSAAASGGIVLKPKLDDTESYTSDDCIPIVVGNVPLYFSRSKDGTPLYIRQYPPQVEELLQSCSEGSPNFEGFSDASGSTFDGFPDDESTYSMNISEGFSEDSKKYKLKTCSTLFPSDSESGDEFAGFSIENYASVADGSEQHLSTISEGAGKMKDGSSLNGKRGNVRLSSKQRECDFKILTSPTRNGKRNISVEHTYPHKRLKGDMITDVNNDCENSNFKLKQNSPNEKFIEGITHRTRCNVVIESNCDNNAQQAVVTRRKSIEVVDAEDFIGEYCSAVGCTVNFLESMRVRKVNVNMGIVYELSEFANKICWGKEYVAKWLQRLNGIRNEEPTIEDLNLITNILRRRKALTVTLAGQKSSSIKLGNFDRMVFILPSSVKRSISKQKFHSRDSSSTQLFSKADENDSEDKSKEEIEIVSGAATNCIANKDYQDSDFSIELETDVKIELKEEEVDDVHVVGRKPVQEMRNEGSNLRITRERAKLNLSDKKVHGTKNSKENYSRNTAKQGTTCTANVKDVLFKVGEIDRTKPDGKEDTKQNKKNKKETPKRTLSDGEEPSERNDCAIQDNKAYGKNKANEGTNLDKTSAKLVSKRRKLDTKLTKKQEGREFAINNEKEGTDQGDIKETETMKRSEQKKQEEMDTKITSRRDKWNTKDCTKKAINVAEDIIKLDQKESNKHSEKKATKQSECNTKMITRKSKQSTPEGTKTAADVTKDITKSNKNSKKESIKKNEKNNKETYTCNQGEKLIIEVTERNESETSIVTRKNKTSTKYCGKKSVIDVENTTKPDECDIKKALRKGTKNSTKQVPRTVKGTAEQDVSSTATPDLDIKEDIKEDVSDGESVSADNLVIQETQEKGKDDSKNCKYTEDMGVKTMRGQVRSCLELKTKSLHSLGEEAQATNDEALKVSPQELAGFLETPAGTLGISKSGRLRKASAKGIQSIEIKCLFMQNSFHVTPAAKEASGSSSLDFSKTSTQCVNKSGAQSFSKVKAHGDSRIDDKRSIRNISLEPSSETATAGIDGEIPSVYLYRGRSSTNVTFTLMDNHLVPKFKETDYNIGPYCTHGGLTVELLNSDCQLPSGLTYGMIKELHDFYMSRGAPKTSLAIRLFKLTNLPILDYGHLLSTVVRITKVAAIPGCNTHRLEQEFKMPKRDLPPDYVPEDITSSPKQQPRVPKAPPSAKMKLNILNPDFKPANASGRKSQPYRPKKIISYPKLDSQGYDDDDDDNIMDSEILHTKGKIGTITRGDIYYLYTKWLRDKMAIGGNVFVTDLLKEVEKLMSEREVQPIRIPAGTLMSSSVKLLDEYKEMLLFSKEDALMYLEEDWLEDIQYLVSKSKSRRSTIDGESSGRPDEESVSGRIDGDSSPSHAESVGARSDSEHSESCNWKETSKIPFKEALNLDYAGVCSKAISGVGKPKKAKEMKFVSYMESVGKRTKGKSIAESLNEFDERIDMEINNCEKRKKEREVIRLSMRETSSNQPVGAEFDYEVEIILNYKEIHYKNKTQRMSYLVRWLGFGPDEDSWVDEEDLQCPELLGEYWASRRRPKAVVHHKPKPLPFATNTNDGRYSSGKPLQFPGRPQTCKPAKSPAKSPESTVKKGSLSPAIKDHDKENVVDNMIHAMIKYTPLGGDAETQYVTRRELLEMYDNWRQENQSVLMAGESSCVDLQVLVGRVRFLMETRGIATFHPESLLNACFMMTVMRTRLKSKKALDTFLDGSCSEVLEASHMQYVKRQYCNIDKTAEMKYHRKKDSAIFKLQSDFINLKKDFAKVRLHRQIDQFKLGALEEELECLQNAFTMSQDKICVKSIILQNELQKLKLDLETLQNKSSVRASTSWATEESEDATDSKLEKGNDESEVIQALVELGVPRNKVKSVQDVVIRRLKQHN